MIYDQILTHFENVRRRGDGKASVSCPCPGHGAGNGDRNQSCTVDHAEGKTLVHCQVGCPYEDVLAAAKPPLTAADLFDSPKPQPRKVNGSLGKLVATFDYHDEGGRVLFQVRKYQHPGSTDKDFRQFRPDGHGGWIANTKGVKKPLYRLPDLLAADPARTAFIAEGEKDCENLRKLGLIATTNCGGAGKWKREYSQALRGRRCAILLDNDGPGRAHGEQVAQSLAGVAVSIKVLTLPGLPPKGDVSDWLAAGHTVEELRALVAAAPEWAPAPAEPVAPDAVIPAGRDGRRPARAFALTETGGAELLADRLAGEIAFVPEWGKWLTWEGAHWKADAAEVVMMERTKLVAHEFLAEAQWALKNDDARAKAFAQFAASAQRRQFRRAVLDLAKSEPGIALPFSQFDCDHYLLNCSNGTVNLHSGELRPHSQKDRITCVLPLAYDPAAKCPRWERFLVEVLPDPETVAFVQRAIGYTLTGDVSEHCLFFLYGNGANGKTVFLNSLLALLAEYATQAPTSMLLAKQGEAHPTELTTVYKRRAVCCQETPAGRGWAEEILKHVTGGDRISARRMREDFWEFSPTHKLWVSGNHKPIVRGLDEGIWRRLRLIPFERVIPEAQRDPKLGEKLCAEMPGVLAWAVRGCLAWQRDRLGQSAKVQTATSDYRRESDRLAPFVVECCTTDPAAVVPRAALYRAYASWSETQGERRPMSDREFAEALRGRGVEECYPRVNGKQQRGWRGIGLADNTDYTCPPEFPYERLVNPPVRLMGENGGDVSSPVVSDPDHEVIS
ncbi:MAG: phage/plasmid primase, P4 family [Polyangia bacterium]